MPTAAERAWKASARDGKSTVRGPAAAGLGGTAIVFLGGAVFFGDGSGDDSTLPLGLAAVLILTGCAVALVRGWLALPRLDGVGWVFVASLAAFVAWAGVGIGWSVAGDSTWRLVNKGLLVLLALAIGALFGASRTSSCRLAAWILTAVLGLAVGWALLGRGIPALFEDGGRQARLRNPVGYWNGLALLAGAAIPLGLWTAEAARRRIVRSAGTLVAYAAAIALLLTLSRAGVVGGVLAVVLWIAVGDRERRSERCALALSALLPAAVVAAFAFTRPGLVDDGVARATRVSDGRLFLLALGIGGVLAVIASLWMADRHRVAARVELGWKTLAAVAAVALAGIAVASSIAGTNPASWAWDELTGGDVVGQGPGRLADASGNNRAEWWGEALDVFRAHRWGGSGAGSFALARLQFREDGTPVTSPHSFPLQALAEGGLVAGLLLVAVAVSGIVAVRRSVRRAEGGEREAAFVLALLPLLFALESLVDYHASLLALTVPTAFALGVLVAAGRPALPAPGWFTAGAAALVGAAAVVALAAPPLADRALDRADRQLDSGEFDRAAATLERARSLNPLSVEVILAQAQVERERGDDARALSFYREATELQPENPSTWYALGSLELRLGRACSAYVYLNRGYTLDPNGVRWVPGGNLDQARDAVDNRGACEPSATG